ncbi:alpha/beta hydrolase [Lentzea sp. HUAS12]|nr:alpha/beta hydrolase [Lentzea sp. HUAS12]
MRPALRQRDLRLVAPDLLGFGHSDKPLQHCYRIHDQAEMIMAVWDHFGIASTDLVAHDYGVSVARELLARCPERITSVAWLNGGLCPDLHRPVLAQRLLHSGLGPRVARAMSYRSFVRSLRSVLGRPVSEEVLAEMWCSVTHARGNRVVPALMRYIHDRRLHQRRWTEALENFAGPMSFFWGPADPISGAHVLNRIRERMPAAQVFELSDPVVGHYPQVEDPERVGALVADFLTASARF